MQYSYSYILLIHIPISKPIGDENPEHCLWFLLCSKSSMLCSRGNIGLNNGCIEKVGKETKECKHFVNFCEPFHLSP